MASTFKGGHHIPDHKELTNSLATKPLPDCDVHIFPLRQHIGVPLTPTVKVGDEVYVGQKIADTDQYMAAPVHSSVSGKVIKIEPYFHDSGNMTDAIFIENDKKYTVDESVKPRDYKKLLDKDLLSAVREAGIVGMGGAGFPTHVKLSPKTKVDYVILNCAECEPYITADHRYMLEDPDEMIIGLKIVMRILNLTEGYIGVELNKADAIAALKASKECNEHIHVVPLKVKYPQGAEKQLIKAVTGRRVPAGGLPSDAGAVVVNGASAGAIARAITTGMPLIERIVTVSGDAIKEPSNFRVRTGVPARFLIESAGGFVAEPEKVISGGPMMGIAQYNIDYPIVKSTSSILALLHAPKTYDPTAPCIRCGRCVSHCPMHLMPYKLRDAAEKGDVDEAIRHYASECIECGLCSYICPANKNLLQFIRIIKPEVLKKQREEAQKNGK